MNYEGGGIAPHISKRKGYVEPPRADIRAFPVDYARRLIANALKMKGVK